MKYEVALLVPLRPDSVAAESTTWAPGPLPINADDGAVESERRTTYFTLAAAKVLYGGLHYQDSCSSRSHRRIEPEADWCGLLISAVEVLAIPGHARVAVIHGRVDGPEAETALRAIDRSLPQSRIDDLIAIALGEDVKRAVLYRRIRRVVFFDSSQALGMNTDPGISWSMGAGAEPDSGLYESLSEEERGVHLTLSQSWSCWVMRDALSFDFRDLEDPTGFREMAKRLAFSVYLDIALLLEVRELILSRLAEQVSEIDSGKVTARAVDPLDAEMSQFRTRVWRNRVSHHYIANRLTSAMVNQRDSVAEFEQVSSDIEEIGRRARRRTELEAAAVLGLIAVVAFPVSTILAAAALVVQGYIGLVVALAISASVSALFLLVPSMRDLIRDLFPR